MIGEWVKNVFVRRLKKGSFKKARRVCMCVVGGVRSKRGMCNNGGKMCRAYFSYLIAMAVPTENGRILFSFSRWRERAAFLELLVWIVTYAYHFCRSWNDNDTAATPIRRPSVPPRRWKTSQLGRTNWISFPIQRTVNSNDSRGESR